MATKRPRRSPEKTTASVKKIRPPKLAEPPVVSVVILNYNTPELTLDCVRSVEAQRGAPSLEIIVVDNASPDGSGPKLRHQLKGRAKVILAQRNLGFGPGNNLGCQDAQGRYLFIINSDTVLLPSTLKKICATADRQPDYGLLSPRILLPGKRAEVQPGSFGRSASLWRLLTRSVDLPASYLDQYPDVAPCDWVTGAAMFTPVEAFWSVGGFDSRYFMYWEDQDLCHSLAKQGWKIGVATRSSLIHLGGRSNTQNQQRHAQYDQSQRTFMLKHHGWFSTALFLALAWPWKWLRNRRLN